MMKTIFLVMMVSVCNYANAQSEIQNFSGFYGVKYSNKKVTLLVVKNGTATFVKQNGKKLTPICSNSLIKKKDRWIAFCQTGLSSGDDLDIVSFRVSFPAVKKAGSYIVWEQEFWDFSFDQIRKVKDRHKLIKL